MKAPMITRDRDDSVEDRIRITWLDVIGAISAAALCCDMKLDYHVDYDCRLNPETGKWEQ